MKGHAGHARFEVHELSVVLGHLRLDNVDHVGAQQ